MFQDTPLIMVEDNEGLIEAAKRLEGAHRGQQSDPGEARIDEYSPERILVRTNSPAGGLLVLTDAFYPGWTATIEGQSVAIHRANTLFRVVFVPSGEQEIIFQYVSAAYRSGLIVFIFTLVIIAFVLLRLWVNGHRKL